MRQTLDESSAAFGLNAAEACGCVESDCMQGSILSHIRVSRLTYRDYDEIASQHFDPLCRVGR